VAITLAAAMITCEALVHEKPIIPNQHVEIEIPVEVPTLSYAPTSTATAAAVRMIPTQFI